ncbi:MAG: B12-binding domain-containing radical SAM protein [Elusimicrobiales bacterium]
MSLRITLINIYREKIHTVPLGLAYLKTYAEKIFDKRVKILIKEFSENEINSRTKEVLKDILKTKPRIIGFSCYVWNRDQVVYLSKLIKKENEKIKIILGGKEVSTNRKKILIDSKADALIEGEGEIAFTEIIKKTLSGSVWDNVPNIVIKRKNKIIKNKEKVLRNLDDIPSPYLKDIFRNTSADYLILETSRGCPFNCPFCLWTIKKNIRFFSLNRVLKEIKWIIDNASRINSARLKVIISDSDFLINPKRAEKILKFITSKAITKEIDWSITTNIKFITKEILKVSNNPHLKFSIGIQSINPKSIKILKRENLSLSLKETEKKLDMIIKYAPKSTLILEIMIGIPGETERDIQKTFRWSMERVIKHILKTKSKKEIESLKKNDIFPINAYIDYCTLSVFPDTPMTKIAKRYKAKWMKNPPYEIISTSTLSKENIKSYQKMAANMESKIKENIIKIISDRYI